MSRHDVLILGGGPAGLAAAARLREIGISDVVLLEREAESGGVPRHCGHPAFGLREFKRLMGGPTYARRLVKAASGIEIRNRTTVTAIEPGGRVRIVHPETGPGEIEGRAILLAFGVRETPRSTRLVGGDRPPGVTTTGALQQFVYLQNLKPFRRAVVVGSELVAFSALLTLRHVGISVAAMIEEAPRITARHPSDLLARLILGAPVLTSARLIAIHGIDKVEEVEIERGGRRERIACDGVVFTGGFRPETAVLAGSHIALDPGSGGPSIDQYWRSSDPRVFVAGNILHPVDTAGVAWAEGRAAATAIADHLTGRLPAANPVIPVSVSPPLRYLYPQRLLPPAIHLSPLMLKGRAMRAATGRLRLLADDRELWSRRMRLLPERRIALPVDRLPHDEIGAVEVTFEEEL